MVSRSADLWKRAQERSPGGVNSPVRAFAAVGGTPRFIARGQGAHLHDVDGRTYLDYVGSWGPLILGHAPPHVVQAVVEAVRNGSSFGAPTLVEVELAEEITRAMPAVVQVRMVCSGTEATMSALRVARAFTGRKLIVKFDGCYHGHADFLLARAGSGMMTLGLPASLGVPEEMTALTLVLPYNNRHAAEALFDRHGHEIAAVIVEPIAGNMGVVPPEPGYLESLRKVTLQHGALLIFDEVISGFRVGYGGAQEMYGITPDLTCLGKIIGGGFPVGAYGGRREIMQMVAPAGPVYQAGTLSGNPVAMRAGLETLRLLQEPGTYETLETLGVHLEAGLREAAIHARVPLVINRVGSMLTPFFTTGPVDDAEAARRSDTTRYARFFQAMLDREIYLPPSQFEAWFVSLVHTGDEIDRTIRAAAEAFKEAR